MEDYTEAIENFWKFVRGILWIVLILQIGLIVLFFRWRADYILYLFILTWLLLAILIIQFKNE